MSAPLRLMLLDPAQPHLEGLYAWHFPDFTVRLGTRPEPSEATASPAAVTVFLFLPDDACLNAWTQARPAGRRILRLHDHLGTAGADLHALRNRLAAWLSSGLLSSAETYDRRDAEALGIAWRPNGVSCRQMAAVSRCSRTSLVTFAGTEQKGGCRLADWLPLEAHLRTLYPQAHRWVRCLIKESPQACLAYSDYLQLIAEAEVQLDFCRVSPEEGWSFRIPEALVLGQKVITNRRGLVSEPFYSPSRFFVVGLDQPARLQAFLENEPEPVPPALLTVLDTAGWWQ